jgi:hypothetical protein
MYVFPVSLKPHLDGLLAAFARTGGRLLDHPSFPVFTQWCEQHAEDLGLREPSEHQVDVINLAHLNLSDVDLRETKDMAEDEPISDDMRLAFITEQVRDALNGDSEPIRFTPSDVMVLGGATQGVVCLGFLYLWQDDGEASYGWQGFFESPDVFRVWLRGEKYLTEVQDVLRMAASERLAYWR